MDIFELSLFLGKVLDFGGVLIIVVGFIYVSVIFTQQWFSRKSNDLYKEYRKNLGRVILLGLEFLVAGDIIRSVVGTPTFYTLGTLGLLVLIRSFLSITFQMEIEGKWPWQKKSD